MSDRRDEMKEKVEARVEMEKRLLDLAKKTTVDIAKELPDSFIRECLDCSRVGDAILYSVLFRGTYLFHKRWGRWLVWAGHHWKEDLLDTYEARIEEVCKLYLKVADELQKLADEEDDIYEQRKKQKAADKVFSRVNALRLPKGRDELLRTVHKGIDEPLAIIGDELDQHPYKLACPNGVIDLRTGDALPGNPFDYLLNACPTVWKGLKEPSPEFEAFLLSSMDGDKEMVDYLQRLLGYGLIPDRRDHVFIIFWGAKGRNGKDTLVKTIRHVLGKALCGSVPIEMYLATNQIRNSSAPSADIMALRGMRISFCNEAEDGQKFAMGKLKELTGGNIITARGVNDKMMSEWKQTNLPIMSTNEIPRAKSDDDAFWYRVQIVPWTIRFVDDPKESFEKKADKDLEKKLEAEASGILAWLVRGALEYLKRGLDPPQKVLAVTRERRDQYDDVGRFIKDCCNQEDIPEGFEPATRESAKDLLDAFNLWFRRNVDGSYSYSARRLGEVLGKKGLKKLKSNGNNVYLGIAIKEDVWQELAAHRKKLAEKADKKGGSDDDL